MELKQAVKYLNNIKDNDLRIVSHTDFLEALEVVLQALDNSISKRKLSNYISKELKVIENNNDMSIDVLDGMKAAYLSIKNIFLEDK